MALKIDVINAVRSIAAGSFLFDRMAGGSSLFEVIDTAILEEFVKQVESLDSLEDGPLIEALDKFISSREN